MISQAHSVGIRKWSRYDLTNVYTVRMGDLVWSNQPLRYAYRKDDLSDGWKLYLYVNNDSWHLSTYMGYISYRVSPKGNAMHCPFGMSTLKYTLWCAVRTHTHAIFGR